MQSSSHKINQKIKFLKVFSFFQNFQKFERTFNVLGEKFSGRDISIEKCTLCLQSIILKIKNFFESFVSFQLFRTWSMKLLDLWQQSFHPGCQKNFLGVHMSSIRDVGIRSDITWRETFFEPRLKNFDLFLKTAFCVSKGTFWVKKLFLKVLFLFQILENFERKFTVLGEIVFSRDIKIENCTLCLQSINLGINLIFESFVSFQLFRTWNMKLSDSWQQSFHPGCQSCIPLVYTNSLSDVGIKSDIIWRETFFEPWRKSFDLFLKTAFYVSKGKIWVKNTFLESSVFFKLFRTLKEHLLCLARKFSAGISKLKKAVFVSWDLSKNQTFESSLFFQILQNFERTFTVLGEKVLGRDIKIEICTLCL